MLRLCCVRVASVLRLCCGCVAVVLRPCYGCIAAVLRLCCGCIAAVLRARCGCVAVWQWWSVQCMSSTTRHVVFIRNLKVQRSISVHIDSGNRWSSLQILLFYAYYCTSNIAVLCIQLHVKYCSFMHTIARQILLFYACNNT